MTQFLQYLFSQSPLFQLFVFALHGLFVFVLAVAFMKLLARRASSVAELVPVGPTFAAITGIFALLLGFHAAAVWSQRQQADRAFIQVQSAIYRFNDIIGPTGVSAPTLHRKLHAYVERAVEHEWLELGNQQISDSTEAAFLDLEMELIRVQQTRDDPAFEQLSSLFNEISRARSERLWVGEHHTDSYAWLSVLLVGFMSHLALGVVHLDKIKAGTLMLALFAITTTIAFWSLGIIADPYRDDERINPRLLLKFNLEAPPEES